MATIAKLIYELKVDTEHFRLALQQATQCLQALKALENTTIDVQIKTEIKKEPDVEESN